MQSKISPSIIESSKIVTEAPIDDSVYVRKNGEWIDVRTAGIVGSNSSSDEDNINWEVKETKIDTVNYIVELTKNGLNPVVEFKDYLNIQISCVFRFNNAGSNSWHLIGFPKNNFKNFIFCEKLSGGLVYPYDSKSSSYLNKFLCGDLISSVSLRINDIGYGNHLKLTQPFGAVSFYERDGEKVIVGSLINTMFGLNLLYLRMIIDQPSTGIRLMVSN